MSRLLGEDFRVISPDVEYSDEYIKSNCSYTVNDVVGNNVLPVTVEYEFKTERRVPKIGLMMVGWGGNNGSTVTAGRIYLFFTHMYYIYILRSVY